MGSADFVQDGLLPYPDISKWLYIEDLECGLSNHQGGATTPGEKAWARFCVSFLVSFVDKAKAQAGVKF